MGFHRKESKQIFLRCDEKDINKHKHIVLSEPLELYLHFN